MTGRALVIVGLLLCLLSPPAAAASSDTRAFAVDLAEGSVDITTGFNGAHLNLFGVKEREGDIAVVIHGPNHQMVVRHKRPFMGIWMNRESATFANVPVYYDLALSRPESVIASEAVRRDNEIGLDSLQFIYLGQDDPDMAGRFREALIRNKQAEGHFPLDPRKITFLSRNFFRTSFYLPPDVPTGLYKVSTYLLHDGKIVDRREMNLRVAQVGLSARLQLFAYRHGLLYGLASIALALVAGWSAHTFLRRD